MNKLKVLLLCVFAIAIGYVAYLGVQFWLAGNPFTIMGFITFVTSSTMVVVNKIVAFAQDKLQIVLAAVGTAITSIVGVYKLASNKIAGIRETAENKVTDVQSQATQQYVDMQGTIKQLESEKESLQSQVQDQSALTSKVSDLETQLSAKETELQKLIAERNQAARDSLSNIVVKCRVCGTDYLKWQQYCPKCQAPQLVKP